MIVTDISPEYCIKGTAVKNLERFISRELSRELYEQIASEVGLFNHQRLISTNWYPVSHLIRMQEICAKKIGMDFHELLFYSSEFTLKEDLRGAYKFLMRLAGAPLLINQMPIIASIYTNFVTLKVLQNSKKFISAYSELPTILTEWYAVASEGAISGILHVCDERLESFKVVKKESYLHQNQQWSRWYFEMRY